MKTLSLVACSLLVAAISMPSSGCRSNSKSAASAFTTLPKTGLKIEVGGDVHVGEAIGGEGDRVSSDELGGISVTLAAKPKTLDAEKHDASLFTPNELKAEPLPDGWALTFNNSGSMGANYFVTVRRDLGGKSFECGSIARTAEQGRHALAACKSLHL